MCIIYSSYIQHLTNKQRKTDYWKKHRWKWGTTKVGAFLSASVGSYVCSTRWANCWLQWLQTPRWRALLSGTTGTTEQSRLEFCWHGHRHQHLQFHVALELNVCLCPLLHRIRFCLSSSRSSRVWVRNPDRTPEKSPPWRPCTASQNTRNDPSPEKKLFFSSVPFCRTSGRPDAEGLWGIPSSSLTEVWSAQTWTLGTLFTHIIVTCKTSL